MKQLAFETYVPKDRATMEDYGTLNAQIGVGGFYKPATKANFLNADKRVAILAKNSTGQTRIIPCSAGVSAGLRNKTIKLSQLGDLHILGDEEGKLFISRPAGAGMPEVAVTSVAEQEVKLTSQELENLIAL